MTRAEFLKNIALAGGLSQIAFFSSCAYEASSILSAHELATVQAVQAILLPDDGNGPSAKSVLADKYLIWLLSDEKRDADVNNFLKNGIKKFQEITDADFHLLPIDTQTKLLHQAANTHWGERWLSAMLTVLIEALLCDPIYGANPNAQGWKWLQHNPGYPRPTHETKYKAHELKSR